MSGGRPQNEDRQTAIALGFRTYTGTVHKRCGTTERYVAGGGCVHCARAIALEQREARKFLQAQAAPIDSRETPPVEIDDDAEARRQAAIDDLM